jgi:hypothetical protein
MAARVEELTKTNALLLDRLIGAPPGRSVCHGHLPVTAAEMATPIEPIPQPPMKSRRTPSDIAALCTADMAKRARAVQVSGQIAPPLEMREANNV